MQAADKLEARYVATGHYVRRRDDECGIHLFKGRDAQKDQSYFLATTTREQIKRVLFPLGDLEKDDTRKLARHFGLPTAEKHESQDICFIPAGDRVGFLQREGSGAGLTEGDIVDLEGNKLGRHHGIAHYTLGQRKGLGLPDGPWHVVALDAGASLVVVAHPEQALIRELRVADVTWIRRPLSGERVTAKVRYQMQPAACSLELENGSLGLRFDLPQKPTAPGQVAAFYAGDELLGGGIVSAVTQAGQGQD